jgi:hypothetical protein
LVEKFPIETPKKFERIGDQEERLKN